MSSKEAEILSFDVNKVHFPSVKEVTFSKMKGTALKFSELGGGPFTGDEILEKMKDVGSPKMILRRVLPFLRALGFIQHSRTGKTGLFTHKLEPSIIQLLKDKPDKFDSLFAKFCKSFPSYLIIWKYSKKEKVEKFTKVAFEAYLSDVLNLKYSKGGLTTWLNALDSVGLISLEKDFISLEGITPPWEEKEIGAEKRLAKTPEEGIPHVTGVPSAPTPMTINVNFDLDYRLSPNIYRETLRWLERMRASGVPITISKREQEKESTIERETAQN